MLTAAGMLSVAAARRSSMAEVPGTAPALDRDFWVYP
jgi:hypothetical protein